MGFGTKLKRTGMLREDPTPRDINKLMSLKKVLHDRMLSLTQKNLPDMALQLTKQLEEQKQKLNILKMPRWPNVQETNMFTNQMYRKKRKRKKR